jgi:hypothetical protein
LLFAAIAIIIIEQRALRYIFLLLLHASISLTDCRHMPPCRFHFFSPFFASASLLPLFFAFISCHFLSHYFRHYCRWPLFIYAAGYYCRAFASRYILPRLAIIDIYY